MALAHERGVVVALARDLDGAVTCAAPLGSVGGALLVQKQVPERHAAAPAVERAEEYRGEVVDQTLAEVVVPRADRGLGEEYLLVGTGVVYAVEGLDAAAVVVPCRARDVACGGRVGKDAERVVLLVGYVVVVVVVVEDPYLGVDAVALEGGAEVVADEVALLLPPHVERHRVAAVEGLVLHRHGIYGYSGGLHLGDPQHEIFGIVVIVHGVEAAVCPALEGTVVVVSDLHPPRARPRRGDDLHRGVYLQYAFEYGDQVAAVVLVQLEELYSGAVAAGVLVEREVRCPDRYAYEAEVHAVGAETLAQKRVAVGLAHAQQVVACRAGYGSAETVDGLQARGRVDGYGGQGVAAAALESLPGVVEETVCRGRGCVDIGLRGGRARREDKKCGRGKARHDRM